MIVVRHHSDSASFDTEQWARLVAMLDAQRMIADGRLNYPGRGLPLVQLVSGSQRSSESRLMPEDIAHALLERETDLRPLAQVHRQAMGLLSEDEDGTANAPLASAMHHSYCQIDEHPYRRLLGLLALGASDDGVEIEERP
jgi:hypothetical protein